MAGEERESKASEYRRRRSETWDVKAPSGFVFTVRRPNLLRLMRQGVIPTRLYTAAMRASGAAVGTPDSGKPEDVKDSLEFVARYLVASVVDPGLVLERKKDTPEDQLAVDDLADEDMTAVFNAVFQKEGVNGSGETPDSFPSKAGSGAA